jgi:hypothetical protein
MESIEMAEKKMLAMGKPDGGKAGGGKPGGGGKPPKEGKK